MLGVGRRDPADQRSVLARSDPPLRHPRHRRDLGRVPAGTAGPGARRRGTGGHAGLAGHPPARAARRRDDRGEHHLDPRARARPRPAARRLLGADGAHRGGHRRPRVRLRRPVPAPGGGRRGSAGRPADAVRRRHGRPRPGRQPALPLHVLGADVGHVVPPDRQRPHRRPGPGRRRCRRCSSPAPAAWRCSSASCCSARRPAPTGSARSWRRRRRARRSPWPWSSCSLGAFTKSAQYPFHAWLPGAMAAPTPVSAYLHSATMVKAGVYLVARLVAGVRLRGASGGRSVLSPSGCVTMVAGGLRALRQHDLKLLLAFGTVSQLGFMFLVRRRHRRGRRPAAALLLLAHAVFKAALFMVVGIIDHETGTRDIAGPPRPRPPVAAGRGDRRGERGVDGRRARWPSGSSPRRRPTRRSPTAAFGGARGSCSPASSVGSMLTVAYSVRFVWGALHRGRDRLGRHAPPRRRHEPSPSAVVRGARRRAGRLHPRPRRGPRHRRRPRRRRHRRRSIAGPRRPCTSRSGTASTSPLVLSAVTLAGGALLVRRPPARSHAVLARGAAHPERRRRLPRRACGASNWSPTGSPASSRTARCRSTRA